MASKVLHRLEFIYAVLRAERGCNEGDRQRDWTERDRGTALAHVWAKLAAIVGDSYGLAIFQSIVVRPIRSEFYKSKIIIFIGILSWSFKWKAIKIECDWIGLNFIREDLYVRIRIVQWSLQFDTISSLIRCAQLYFGTGQNVHTMWYCSSTAIE